jgi:Fe-S oxidoreductase
MSYDYRAHFGEVTLTHDLMSRRDDRRWRLTPAPASGEHHDIVLYLGCNVLRTSHMVQTVTAIFDLLGLDYVAVGGPSYCCGIVHHTQGDTAAARGMSEGTIRLFERFSPREVVMWCPSCIYFYDEVQQLTLPFPFRQAAEFLVQHLPALRFTREVRQRVALHYHVQNDSRRREGKAGRALLEAVPGLTFVPISRSRSSAASARPASSSSSASRRGTCACGTRSRGPTGPVPTRWRRSTTGASGCCAASRRRGR